MVTKLRRKFNVRENSGSAKAETVAGKDGKWLVKLDLSKDDGKGKDLIITEKNKIVAKDVITGEVWFCKTIEIKKMTLQAKKSSLNSASPRRSTGGSTCGRRCDTDQMISRTCFSGSSGSAGEGSF